MSRYNENSWKKSEYGNCQKGQVMTEAMTDYQFKALLKMVLEILRSSKDITEAIKKITELLDEK